MRLRTGPQAARQNTIYLVGFMGCGKTTVGRLLAQRMAWKFIDLDQWIEQEEGAGIGEIFARKGEAAFRQQERALLRKIVEDTSATQGRVVALGGGTFAQAENVDLLRSANAVTIWLDCPIDDLLMRCALMTNRPLFRDEASFRRLYEERLPYYRQASYRVRSGRGEPHEVVQQILSLPIFDDPTCDPENGVLRPPASPAA